MSGATCPECGGALGEVDGGDCVGGGSVCAACGFVDVDPWVCMCGAGWRADGPDHAIDCPCWDPFDPCGEIDDFDDDEEDETC